MSFSEKFADPSLEESVLAALGDEQAFLACHAEGLRAEAFSSDAARKIFLSLEEAFLRKGDMPRLPDATPPADLSAAVKRLLDLWRRRKVAEVLQDSARALGSGRPVDDVVRLAMDGLFSSQVSSRGPFQGALHGLSELLPAAESLVAEANRLASASGQSHPYPPFPPGQEALTGMIGGMRPGFYVLGGPPAAGKTHVALSWTHAYLSQPDAVAVWVDVMETRPVELLALRLACMHAKANPYLFERGRKPPGEFQKIANALQSYVGDRFFVVESSKDATASFIAGAVRRAMASSSGKRAIVVVDYVQKLSHFAFGGGFSDLRQRVIHTIACLGELTSVAQGPVVAISSLSKDAYRRGVQEANLSDFKESGEVEYTADVGLQLRLANDERNGQPSSAIRVLAAHLVKNRFGPTASFKLYCDLSCSSYLSQDPGPKRLLPNEDLFSPDISGVF